MKYYEMAHKEEKFEETPMREIIAFIKENLNEGTRILDIGCGTANILNKIPSKGYTGVDVSEYAIEEAKGRWPGATLSVERLERLPFDDASFDMVLSFASLEHFSNPKNILSEVGRVLKPKGYFIVNAPNLELPFCNSKGQWIAPICLRHKSILWRTGFFLHRVYNLVPRSLGLEIFEMTPDNIFDTNGIYEKPDDDLRYLVCASTVILYLERRGMLLQHFYSKPVGNLKRALHVIPALRYVGLNFAAVFQKT